MLLFVKGKEGNVVQYQNNAWSIGKWKSDAVKGMMLCIVKKYIMRRGKVVLELASEGGKCSIGWS